MSDGHLIAMDPANAIADYGATTAAEHESIRASGVAAAGAQDRASRGNPKLDDVTAMLASNPMLVQPTVQGRPDLAPALWQKAKSAGKSELAAAIKNAIVTEFSRSFGLGRVADALFHASLMLDGPDAGELRAALEASLKLGASADKRSHLHDAQKHPAKQRLYGAFMSDPKGAAAQLLEEATNDPSVLDEHSNDLVDLFIKEPERGAELLDAVAALKGDKATIVKLYVIRASHSAITMRDSFSKQMLHPTGNPIRVEKLVPLLARLVSQPEMAKALVTLSLKRSAPKEQQVADMPTLKQLMEALLDKSYSDATRSASRVAVTIGATQVVQDAAGQPSEKRRDAKLEVAGTFLGTAARAQEDVGMEESVAEKFMEGVELVKSLAKATKVPTDSDAVGLKVLELIAKKGEKPDWNETVVNELLQEVYSTARPRPVGPSDSQAAQDYDADNAEWSRIGSQSFKNAYEGK